MELQATLGKQVDLPLSPLLQSLMRLRTRGIGASSSLITGAASKGNFGEKTQFGIGLEEQMAGLLLAT